jgi:hypothetical protein
MGSGTVADEGAKVGSPDHQVKMVRLAVMSLYSRVPFLRDWCVVASVLPF